MPIRRLEKSYTGTTSTIGGDELAASTIPVKPHIQPGVLQPAIAGKDLSGTALGGSYTYGTAHTDGHSYYYTDIKRSKPIKDPRIGAHFGSQRHKTKSLQLLEQETASEGKDIFSIDGREWMRAYSTGGGIASRNWSTGHLLEWSTDCTGCYIEIVGYFNDINFIVNTDTNKCDDVDVTVNGTLSVDGSTTLGGDVGIASPLAGRYVDGISIINGGSTLSTSLGTTPAINTVKYEAKTGSSEYIAIGGIELIAQDTTSTANKSKIQIPSQNVVSYGKKFSVSATATHYDPFNGFTNGTTLFSANVDTATSLGLGTGTTYGAPWAISSSNHIRPLNGGRVVKWVDSSGTIKTSVTMMPRNAQSLKTTASNEITTASATNTHTINFSDDAIENSLAEIAKTFHVCEFGNGSANQGHGGSWQDFTMTDADGSQNIAYAMDDSGTTNLRMYEGYITATSKCLVPGGNGSYSILEFIGTGVGLKLDATGRQILAQNLPYGTHILKIKRDADSSPVITLDGITVYDAGTSSASYYEIDIFQPKKPPIPEDACILADYMLMADYVKNTTANSQHDKYISKGVRRVSCSRDIWANKTANGWSLAIDHYQNTGMTLALDTTTGAVDRLQARLPAFATQIEASGFGDRRQIYVDDGSAEGQTVTGSSYDAQTTMDTAKVLGTYTFKSHSKLNTTGTLSSIDVVTPIHTSSHYQPFETPLLHELVGGDRNMEQNNLIVTSDGKSWDEVTRNTSYTGPKTTLQLCKTPALGSNTSSRIPYFSIWRGTINTYNHGFNKNIAYAWDRVIILEDGHYEIDTGLRCKTGLERTVVIVVNDVGVGGFPYGDTNNGDRTSSQSTWEGPLKRGDTVHMKTNTLEIQIHDWNYFRVTKIG